MSFLTAIGSFIKKEAGKVATIISGGLKVETAVEGAVEPVIAVLDPPLAAILAKVQTVVPLVEGMITTAESGPLKLSTATTVVTTELNSVQEIIAAWGSTYKIPEAQIQAVINAVVSTYNALAAIKASAPATPPPAA